MRHMKLYKATSLRVLSVDESYIYAVVFEYSQWMTYTFMLEMCHELHEDQLFHVSVEGYS